MTEQEVDLNKIFNLNHWGMLELVGRGILYKSRKELDAQSLQTLKDLETYGLITNTLKLGPDTGNVAFVITEKGREYLK